MKDYLQVFSSRRMAVILFLGFSSGLPLPLTSGTLQAWLTVSGIDIRTIGLLSAMGIPYTLKFLWSPLMDRFVPPWLGRRRGWIAATQVILSVLIAAMGALSPEHALIALALLGLLVALTSASQDIVIDAYRTDVLPEKERGVGAAIYVLGYRLAMLVAGALALILSERIGWHSTYLLMAALMVAAVAATVVGPEPDRAVVPPRSLKEAAWGPLRDFFSRKGAPLFLLTIVLYKLGDAYAGSMTTAFLIRGAGFSVTDVGTINKGMGLVATIVGALFGGALMVRMGLVRSLLYFGFLQMISNLSFMVLAWTGKNYGVMVFAVGFENLAGGMGTSAFVALLMTLCNARFSATQFALLSSLASLGRVLVAPTSGFMVDAVGWALFFFISTLTALPGLFLLWYIRGEISALKGS